MTVRTPVRLFQLETANGVETRKYLTRIHVFYWAGTSQIGLLEEKGTFCCNFDAVLNYKKLDKHNIDDWSKSHGRQAFGHYAAFIVYLLKYYKKNKTFDSLPYDVDITEYLELFKE